MVARILVVDDSPTVRKVVCRTLSRRGFECTEAGDGEIALTMLRHGRSFDLVLLDFVMPRKNGYQFCRELAAELPRVRVPVVLMSAKAEQIRERFLQQTGARDSLGKPFDAEALLAVVEHVLARPVESTSPAEGKPSVESYDDETQVFSAAMLQTVAEGAGALTGAVHELDDSVALRGSLTCLSAASVLQLLVAQSLSGELVLRRGDAEVSLVLGAGKVDLACARGGPLEFRLGRYFATAGLLSPAELDAFLAAPASDEERRVPLGERLLAAGKIDRDALAQVLTLQTSELVYEVIRWPRGQFEFRPDVRPALADRARLSLHVPRLLLDGFRRVDEWRHIEHHLRDFDAVLAVKPGLSGLTRKELTETEDRVLALLDGARSVREVVSASSLSSFEACKIMVQLKEAGAVLLQGEPA